MAKAKVNNEKPTTKRGRKPKTTEAKTMLEIVTELNSKISDDREMFFDIITQMRKRISDFERVHFVLDCIILIAIFIITLALIYKQLWNKH